MASTFRLLLLALLLASSLPLQAAEANHGFTTLLDHYEPIRQALAGDSTTGIADHATALHKQAEALAQDFNAQHVGIQGDAATARQALTDAAAAAARLAQATDLKAARAGFDELSQALMRYRAQLNPAHLPADRGQVAYCPMARKSWLQPAGPIGNPYFGSEMLTCGRIVTG